MYSLHKSGIGMLAAGALVLVGLNAPATHADGAASRAAFVSTTVTNVTVTPRHLHRWVQRAFENNDPDFRELAPQQAFVRGPATPPAGIGSLRFKLRTDDTDRIEQFRTTRYDGVRLERLRRLKYSTYQRATSTSPTPKQPVYLRLSVDNDGDGQPDDALFFFPANNANQHLVQQRTWQTWNAGRGRFNLNGDTGPEGSFPLRRYRRVYPNARIVNTENGRRNSGGLAFIAGDPTQAGGRYFLDRIVTGRVGASGVLHVFRFDLEPTT